MSDNKTNINCEKLIYINIPETIDNTGFLTLRFLHFLNNIIKRGK